MMGQQILLVAKPGHVVEVSDLPSCDFCGGEATWDIPTYVGPWANACDECEPHWHTRPGVTGVGIGQRLITRQPEPGPFTVGAILRHKASRMDDRNYYGDLDGS
jgi:hypothetical protein